MKLLNLFNNHRKTLSSTSLRLFSNILLRPPWDVLFFGTDNFSLESLKTLHTELRENSQIIRKLEVVTTNKNSYVKKYAEEHSICIQQWPLQTPAVTCKQFHIGVVVSFGNLIPKAIIEAFPLGMINVHASLLPRWRGAAPIIHALAAGDEKTGVTIMRIRPHKFDIGEIIHQEDIPITNDVRMPQLHDSLARIGARNLLQVLRQAPKVLDEGRIQDSQEVTLAPRVKASMANVNFNEDTAKGLYNLGRALAGLYPLIVTFNGKIVKLHNIISYTNEIESNVATGTVVYLKHAKLLQVVTKDGAVFVDKISVPGKKVMNAMEFRNGYLKNTTNLFSSVHS